MKREGLAHFVSFPRRINDLRKPYALDQMEAYVIVKTIRLSFIDYENFLTDMTVDRDFIERNAHLCENGRTKKCLFVHASDHNMGVLVVPQDCRWVGYAAWADREAQKGSYY